jgi:phenylalanyl-tRNA synthetase beta chain
MRVKLEWLNELVDLKGLSIEEIVNRVSLYSVEVEGVEKLIEATNIVIGHVLTKTPHPDSDHLNVLTVDVSKEILQIVCGAPNVEAGQYVIVAVEGAVLPGNFKIKRSKIRGVESCGMVCSLQELGIEKKFINEKFSDGIYYFSEPQTLGQNGAEALNLADEVIELGLTPNRGDLLSMLGVAYELSAVFNRSLKPLAYELKKHKGSKKDLIDVTLSSEHCLSYYAQVIQDVQIKPSPTWLISRLIAFGVRPINNVVDITNYILALFGQPLHAFDYDLLGTRIEVRNAKINEEMTTLDGLKRQLLESDLVITDGKKPVALAGVMGGIDTEVTSNTKALVIEAAVFDPLTVRKTSARLGLRSESSIRYERGVDLNRTKLALDYAGYLFQTLANARVIEEVSFAGINNLQPKEIQISENDVKKRLGLEINKAEIIRILKSLSFEVNDDLMVLVPNRRSDIVIKEDLIEEIGRLNGYDKLPITYPIDDMVGELTESQKLTRLIRSTLNQLGLYETVNYSLVNKETNQLFNYNHKDNIEPIELLMPLSEDRRYLRYGLLPSLIEVMKYNFSRKIQNLSIFEIGKVYYKEDDNNHEEKYLAGALANQYSSTLWDQKVESVDFYLVKGILNNLFETIGIEAKYVPIVKVCQELHPKRTASIIVNGKEIGYLGQLHPKYALDNNLENVYVFEIKLFELLNIQKEIVKYTPITKLPSVERDIALVVKKDVLASDLIDAIKKTEQKLLSDALIFDVYVGDKVANDEKSIAIKLIFTSEEALTDEVINNKMKRIVKDLNYRFNATLRS